MAVSKRVQVMLRPGLHEVVEELADEQNLPLSRVCGYLIEQALVNRGLWDEELRKRIQKEDIVEKSPAAASFNKTDLLDIKGVSSVETVSSNTKNQEIDKTNIDPQLLAMAKKLQTLKELELI